MNKVDKLVRNAAIGKYAAACESAKWRKKKGHAVSVLAAAVMSGFHAGAAFAADEADTTSTMACAVGQTLAGGNCVANNTNGTHSIMAMGGAMGTGSIGIMGGGNFSGNGSGITISATNSGGSGAPVAASASNGWDIAIGNAAVANNTNVAGGTKAVAIGSIANATGEGAIAIGDKATANNFAVAVGQTTLASGSSAVAYGSGAQATGASAVALGNNARATGANSTYVGSYSTIGAATTGTQAFAGGYNVNATGIQAVAIGSLSAATANYATTLGSGSKASGTAATAIGANATASDSGAIAIGGSALVSTTAANAAALHAVSIGESSSVTGSNSVAMGFGANASASNAVALGAGSVANVARTVSVGNGTTNNKIVNMAAGLANTDAVNVSQLSSVAAALGGNASINATTGLLDGPTYNLTHGGQQTTVGGALTELDKAISNAGAGGVLYDDPSTKQKVTLGGTAATTPVLLSNVASGSISANSTDAINGAQLFGTANSVAVALGAGSVVNSDGSITTPAYVLDGSPVTGGVEGAFIHLDGRVIKNTNDIADLTTQIGDVSAAAVMYDDPSSKTRVSLGGAGAASPVKLANVASGDINAGSTDAINGAQLFRHAGSVSTALGGGSVVNPDGSITMPAYVLDGSPVAGGVEGAFTHLDGRVIKNTHDIADLTTQIGDVSASAVLYDDPSAKTRVTLGGAGAASPVTITNVAKGNISANSTDAINGAQLYATNQQVSSNTGNINDLLIGHAGLVQQADAAAPVMVAANSGGRLVTVSGTDGDRQIRGVAAGTQDDDAVNVGQLKDLAGYVGDIDALAVKYDDVSLRSITLGGVGASAPVAIHNVANGVSTYDAVNFGQLTDLQKDLQTKIGGLDTRVTVLENEDRKPPYLDGVGGGGPNNNANAGDTPGVALGYNATATGDNASAAGHNAQALGTYGLAVGNDSYAAGDHDTAIGGNAKVGADNSVAVGANSSVAAGASNATAIGADSSVSAASGMAIGQGATVTSSATNAVALGTGSVADRDNTVSVGSEGSERQITNVAAGIHRTDAANWGQVQDSVNNVKDWANQKFTQIDRRINRMGAMSAAYGQMAFSAQGLETKNRLGVGVGNQGGQSAIAVGYSRQLRPNVNLSFGGSASAGDASVGAGLAVGW